MIAALSRSAAACSSATLSSARKALSFLRKPICFRFSSCSMKEWPFEPVGGRKGKETRYTHDDGSQDCIPDIEVVVGEAASLVRQNAMVRIFRGIFGHADAEGSALLQAFENEVNAVGVLLLHAAQRGQNVVLFAGPF